MPPKTSSKIISKVLSPALQLWLRSQLDRVESLQIGISGSDRQILRGHIPLVALSSSRAVYQGLHLDQVEVTGENIGINLGGILKGQALRLIEPILISTKVILDSTSLKSSLASSLLSNALTDLLSKILIKNSISNYTHSLPESLSESLHKLEINWQEVILEAEKLTLVGSFANSQDETNSVILCTGLSIANSHTLRLHPLIVEILPEFGSFPLDEFLIDLGPEVDLKELTLTAGEILVSGRLKVTS